MARALDGGERAQVTKLPLDVGAFAVSPDGAQLAVAMEVFPDCAHARVHASAHRGEGQGASARAGVYDKLFVRHWDAWEDGTRSHLFVAAWRGGHGRGEPT